MNHEGHSRGADSARPAAEVGGTIVVMLAGALVGMFVPLKAEGAVTNVVVGAILGWAIWKCRNKPPATTFMLCLGLLIILWPITFAILDWLHQYY